ncbi:hypothetical protein Hanom_Chr11g01024351 [Helianthus anomalus]
MFQSILLSIPIINCKNSSLFLLVYSFLIHDSSFIRFILLMFVNIWILKMKLISKLIDMRLKTIEMNLSLDSTCQTICVETPKESVAKTPVEREDFRKTFKEANPDNKKVAKEGGEKWK